MTQFPSQTRKSIRLAAELIRNAKHVVTLTGAGSSTPSGIPDFRSPGSGLWSRYQPMEVASLTTFRHNPKIFFDWMRPLANHLFNAQPNPAHVAMAQLEQSGYIQTVITQNIDALHQRAGSKKVLEIHGTMESLTCINCYKKYSAEGFIPPYIENGSIPQCPDCNGVLKPDVVLFEEQLPIHVWLEAKKAVQECDLMLVAGSSLVVMPVAGLPLQAYENGARIIIVNLSATYIDEVADVVVTGDVSEIIPAIAAEVFNA
jgi:NAD-dependent deacetylase